MQLASICNSINNRRKGIYVSQLLTNSVVASWCVAGRLLHSPLTALNAAARAVRKNGELRGPAQASFYESLVQEAALKTASSGEWVQVTVPALSLWGLLVVTPQK